MTMRLPCLHRPALCRHEAALLVACAPPQPAANPAPNRRSAWGRAVLHMPCVRLPGVSPLRR